MLIQPIDLFVYAWLVIAVLSAGGSETAAMRRNAADRGDLPTPFSSPTEKSSQ